MLAPDVTYRVIGQHSLAGTFAGPDEVMRHLTEVRERTSGTLDAVKWDDWLVGENHVGALLEVHIRANARKFSGRVIYLLRFDVDDLITDILVVFGDEDAAARYFGP
jgi:ketosteroid isomerase-like protein